MSHEYDYKQLVFVSARSLTGEYLNTKTMIVSALTNMIL